MITQDELQCLVDYDQDTGVFTRAKNTHKGRWKKGETIGSPNGNGYLQTRINGHKYFLHRLAWLYVYGEMPKVVDHINKKKDDNRIYNLRNTNYQGNSFNGNNRGGSSKYKGVTFHKNTKKWNAQIHICGKGRSLGLYDTEYEAHLARKAAEKKYGIGEYYNYCTNKPKKLINLNESERNKSGYKHIYERTNGYEISINKKYYGKYKTLSEATIALERIRNG